MKRLIFLLSIFCALALLSGCQSAPKTMQNDGCDSVPVSTREVLPEECQPFSITYNPELYTLGFSDGGWYLCPVPNPVDREGILRCYPELASYQEAFREKEIQRLTECQEAANAKLAQSGIEIRHLEGLPPKEAAARYWEQAKGNWFELCEIETVESLGGFGFHAMQEQIDGDIVMEDQIFADDGQGGSFHLICRYFVHQMTPEQLSLALWNILCTFHIPGREAGSLRPLGITRNAVAYADSWQEAYRMILYNMGNHLADPDHTRSILAAQGLENPYIYLGIHDFDEDGIPELIIGDGISLGVFTFANGCTQNLSDNCELDGIGGFNGVTFYGHSLRTASNGAGGSDYVYFGYVDGAYRLARRNELTSPEIAYLNGVPVSPEDVERSFPAEYTDDKAHIKRTMTDGDWWLEVEGRDPIRVDENFDFLPFVWK